MNPTNVSASKPTTIIAIHGVGDAKPGTIPQEVSKAIDAVDSPQPTNAYLQADINLGGVKYPCLTPSHTPQGRFGVNRIVEVNWADIEAPSNSPWSLLRHLFFLLVGMRHLSIQKFAAQSKLRPVLARLFWFSIEAGIWWSAYFANVVMWLASVNPTHPNLVLPITIASTLLALLMAWGLGKVSNDFKAGYVWSLVILLTGLNFEFDDLWLSTEQIIALSAWLYSWTQAAMGFLLILAFLETFIVIRQSSWDRAAARAAFMWIPFLVICAIGAAVWAISVYSASEYYGFSYNEQWQKAFLESLEYDLLWAEIGTLASVVFVFLLLPAIGALFYISKHLRSLFASMLGKSSLTPSSSAHEVYSAILKIGPWALILGGVPFWYSLFLDTTSSNNLRLIEIYQISATRWLSVIPLLFPALRILLDVASDVIFHLQPEGVITSTKGRTTGRIANLINHLNKTEPGNKVVILSHSQGSIITRETLIDTAKLLHVDTLLTLGSPINSLYLRFLGENLDVKLKSKSTKWFNLFNDGDYIGGKVQNCDENIDLGPGGHTGYWSKPSVIEFLINKGVLK